MIKKINHKIVLQQKLIIFKSRNYINYTFCKDAMTLEIKKSIKNKDYV